MSDLIESLQPCPFCGSSKVAFFELEDETSVISCDGCNAQGGYYVGESTDPDEAVEFWNRRALSDQNRLTGGWRDIESAPKDKRFLGRLGDAVYPTENGQYYDKWPHEEGGPTYRDEWNRITPGAISPWRPTHWMPIEPLPLPGGEEKR